MSPGHGSHPGADIMHNLFVPILTEQWIQSDTRQIISQYNEDTDLNKKQQVLEMLDCSSNPVAK